MKMKFLVLLLLLVSASASAGMTTDNNRNQINNLFPEKLKVGDKINNSRAVLTGLYDFSVHTGSSAAAINIDGITTANQTLPAGAIVTNVYVDELTNVTSGGSATVKLLAGETDLTDATAIASFAGADSVALASSATAIKLSSAGALNVVIATADLTAGKIRYYVEYFLADDTPNP